MIEKIIKYIRTAIFLCFNFKKFESKKIYVLGRLSVKGNKINNDSKIVFYDNVKIVNHGVLHIGKNVKIGDNCIIYCNNHVFIGDNTIIAANSYIIDCNHGTKKSQLIIQQPLDNGKVFIGDDCWLGEDVTIAKGANIQQGCVIGAKSFVNKSIPPYSIAVGAPAKVIKSRN